MCVDLAVPEFIALSGAQRIQMDQQRIALGIAPVAADADVLRIDDDIPRLPLLRISWPCRQRLRMTLKKYLQCIHPAKIDVGIRRLYAIRLRIGRDVFIDHILQRIPCMRKGMPDDIGADAMIIIRIAAA